MVCTYPGLKVVYPSTPIDAKGLLIAAINDPNPVMYFEHKALYRSISGPVPEEYYEIEIGKARHVREGDEISALLPMEQVCIGLKIMLLNIRKFQLTFSICVPYCHWIMILFVKQ